MLYGAREHCGTCDKEYMGARKELTSDYPDEGDGGETHLDIHKVLLDLPLCAAVAAAEELVRCLSVSGVAGREGEGC